MQNVIFVIHLLTCVALISVVLLQRSEGGALGIGGSGSSFMTGRGAAGALVRITIVLGGVFFTTSLVLTTLNSIAARAPSSLEREIIGTQGIQQRPSEEGSEGEVTIAPPPATAAPAPSETDSAAEETPPPDDSP